MKLRGFIPKHWEIKIAIMNTSNDLVRQMAEKTNDQLLGMLKVPDDWQTDALDAAKTELKNRNVDFSKVVPIDRTIKFSDADLLSVAKNQKYIIWLILLSIPVYICSVYIPFLPLVLSIVALMFIYRLARAIKDSSPWVYVVLGVIPCISLIALLVINGRATAVLKARGVRVGLMGASKDDLEKLHANSA